jgi:DNA polymerase III subunit chi
METRFYHLTRRPVEAALPALLAKVLAGGRRAVVRVAPGADTGALSGALWTWAPEAFLAHGLAPDGPAPADQPIWITARPGDNPGGADVAFLLPGAAEGAEDGAALTCRLFTDGDAAAVQAARAAWRALTQAGAARTYWQETPQGGWEKKG